MQRPAAARLIRPVLRRCRATKRAGPTPALDKMLELFFSPGWSGREKPHAKVRYPDMEAEIQRRAQELARQKAGERAQESSADAEGDAEREPAAATAPKPADFQEDSGEAVAPARPQPSAELPPGLDKETLRRQWPDRSGGGFMGMGS